MAAFHWQQDFDSAAEAVFALITYCSCTLILFVIIVAYFYHRQVYPKFGNIPKALRWTAISSTFFNFIYVLGTLIMQSIGLSLDYFQCLSSVWPTMFVGYGRLSLYYFFVARLHFTFRGTNYQVEKRKLIIVAILMATTVFTALSIHYYNIVSQNCIDESYIIGGAIASLQDTLWTTTMFIWFYTKLRAVMKSIEEDVTNRQTQMKMMKMNKNKDKRDKSTENANIIQSQTNSGMNSPMATTPMATPPPGTTRMQTLETQGSMDQAFPEYSSPSIDIDSGSGSCNGASGISGDEHSGYDHDMSVNNTANTNTKSKMKKVKRIESKQQRSELKQNANFLQLNIKLCILSFVAMISNWISTFLFVVIDPSIPTSIDVVVNS